jgi:hypothetical protein
MAEDDLHHLSSSAPDIEINAPVTIRWADDLLRELSIEPERWGCNRDP